MFKRFHIYIRGLPWWLSGKESACNVGDLGLVPGLRRSPEEDIATHSSTLAKENPMDRGARQAAVHRVSQS